jgi:hypothetical protein
MSGAGVVVGSLLIGVVRSHNRAAGGQSLTITPLTAIDQLPLALRNQFWDALGIEDSDLLRTLPDSEAGVDGRMDSGRLVRVGKPPMRADCFQARSAGAVLARVVADGQTAILTEEATLGYATQVLSGMGGVGKTQVAAGYARSVWADPALAVAAWVTVHSRAAIISDYAKLANQVIGADLRDPEQSASEFLSWLQTAKRRWLIVLDDIHDFADITGLWPPNTATGQVVVTTRNRGAGLIRRDRVFINVAVFTSIESTNYIREKFKEHPHLIADDIAVAELAADLGYLPLALAQATAYMLNRSLTVQEYRRRLVDQRKKLTQLFPEKGELPDDQSRTIKATWSMSVDLANRLMPTGMARPLLEVASLLDPGGIPASLFTSESIRNYMTARLDQSVDPEDIHDGLHILHRLSLATFDTTERHATIQVHSLVQRATRDTLTKSRVADAAVGQLSDVAYATADALFEIWPNIESDTELAKMLRANTDALIAHGGDYLWDPDEHPLLFRAGESLSEAGLLTRAIAYLQAMYQTAVRKLGQEHPDTLAILGNLAMRWAEAGNTATALTVLEQVLDKTAKLLGPNHPNTLISRNNLARWRGERDPAEAIAEYERLLADEVRVFGANSPEILTTRNNLAMLRAKVGDVSGVVGELERLLDEQIRILGVDHPETLRTRNNLAANRAEAGDIPGAIAEFERLLTDEIRILGPEHPKH